MDSITRRGFAAAPLALAAAPALAKPKAQPTQPSLWPDATEMAASIRRGELSALEATRTAIDRVLSLQPKLNFMVASDFDRALDKARRGPDSGPFAGVPFLIKDLEDYKGLPTRDGSRAMLPLPAATTQDPLTDAFDRSGVVVLGKSATPEAGFLPTTEPLAFGPTRNPWDTSRSSGGSSGGAAAAVAAGVVPFASASDGGGSIRIPASCCGLFGMKPSRGRMLGTRDEDRFTDFSVRHVLTRSVRDSAAMFAAVEKPAGRLPPVGLITAPGKQKLRIGLILNGTSGAPPSPEVKAATESAARLLEDLGHRVTPVAWPVGPEFIQDFLLLWASGAAGMADQIGKAVGHPAGPNELEPFSLGLVEFYKRASPEVRDAAGKRLAANAAGYNAWFDANRLDAVVSPVLQTPAPPLGFVGPSVPFDTLVERLIAYVGYTPYHNVTGAPAMSVPLTWTDSGLPIGTQVWARTGGEATLFRLAYQLEAARPWAHRIPPVR